MIINMFGPHETGIHSRGMMAPLTCKDENSLSAQLGNVRNWMQTGITPVTHDPAT